MDAECSRSCRLNVLMEPPQMVVDVFARYGMELPHLILELRTSIWALQVGFVDLESNLRRFCRRAGRGQDDKCGSHSAVVLLRVQGQIDGIEHLAVNHTRILVEISEEIIDPQQCQVCRAPRGATAAAKSVRQEEATRSHGTPQPSAVVILELWHRMAHK